MPRGNPVINISLASDVDAYIKDLKGQLGSLGKAGIDLGLADTVKSEIKAIEKMLDGLQKTLHSISGTKLNSSTFSKFQDQIAQQIDALDKRTTALESTLTGLMSTMSSGDVSKMSSGLKDVRDNMDALNESTQKTVQVISEVQNIARNNSNIQIVDATKSIGDLKALKALAENITKQFDKEPKFSKPKNLEEAIGLIGKLTDEYGELDEKITELDEKEERTFDESKKLLEYKNHLVEIGREIERIYDFGYEEGWGSKFSQFDYLTQQLDKELSQIQEDTESYVENINKELSRIGKNANIPTLSSESISKDKQGLTVPINLRTTSKGLLSECMKLLTSVQDKLSDTPLEVDLALTTKWGTKRNKELLKQFQQQINGLTDQSNISEFQSLYNKIAKSFGDEIELKVGSNIKVVEEQIRNAIKRLRKYIKDNPLNIDLEFDVSAENKAALQASLTDITSDIVVTIKKVKFAKELNVKNALQEDFDQISTEQLDKLLAKIDELKEASIPMVQTLSEIREVFNSLSTDKLVSELKEVIRLLQVGFNALSINELDDMFANLQKRISNISGSLRGANLNEIKNILADFKEYQSLGGQNNISDLGGTKNIQSWLKKHIDDQQELQTELNETANNIKEVNQAIESENISQLIQPLNQVIELIDKKTQAFRNSSVATSQSIDNEISDLNRLSTYLEEIVLQIQSISGTNTSFDAKWLRDLRKIKAEDLTRVSDALSSMFETINKLNLSDNNFIIQIQQILDKGSELANLAKILSESTKKINDIAKNVNAPFSKDDLDIQRSYKEADEYLARENEYIRQRNLYVQEGINQEKQYIRQLEQEEAQQLKIAKDRQTLLDKIEGNLSKASKYTDSNKYTDEFIQNIQSSIDKFHRLKEELDKPISAEGLKNATEEAKKLANELNDNIAQKALPSMKKASEQTINKAILKIDQFVNANSKMGRKWRQEFENLRIEIRAADSIEEVQRLTSKVIELESAVVRAGKSGKSFMDTLGSRIKQMSTNFIAMYFSLYDIVRYVRTAVDTINELDTALIDLRKTTTMSADELNEFYYNANDVAKQMGTSTEQIISQAAAWSRLGYQSKEAATEMAALSSQFAAISPGMDLDKATDGLVSTMKAFHIDVQDVEREVMDNVNRIGNTMATSNEEIVEMLTRSSAAMNAANNSIEETIALESAAVQITRNAETTGMYSAA